MFQTLGRIAYRRRRSVLAAWGVIFAVGMALMGVVLGRLSTEQTPRSDIESARVMQAIDDLQPRGPEVVAIVDADVGDPSVRAAVEAARDDLLAIDGVATVIDPYVTPNPALHATDSSAFLLIVLLQDGVDEHDRQPVVDAVVDRLREVAPERVEIGGAAVIMQEFQTAVEKDLSTEQKAMPIAFIVMVFILGGLIAAGLPLVIAFASVAGSMFVLLAATGMMDVSVYAMNVVFMFGLGLGIDYGLLMVSRFREERAAGRSIEQSVQAATATAGRTVAFSALTVAASLAGLFAFDDDGFRSFGIAGIGVVLVAMLAALTLLPALLAVFGARIKPAPARRDGHRFATLARFVQRRAVATVVVVGGVLVAVALPFLSARFENSDARSLPRSSEARAVALSIGDRFPAHGADPIVVVARTDATDPDFEQWLRTVGAMGDVTDVSVRPGTPAGTAIVDVVPVGTSQGEDAQRVVQRLRDHRPAFGIEVGGNAAALIDLKDDTASRLPVAFAIIVVATFVLLFLMTGSIAVPLKAIVMNVLSLGATFGALVWGFQEGHLAGVLGFEPVGSLDLFMPVLIFIFAFGLSMDYEVFLLSRIKEVYDRTGDNDRAVAEGLQRTGGIVTSAALLIVVVFAGFAMGEVLSIKMLGFGLGLAVIVDAVVVRTLLVPATMKLLGHRNWWAPAPLRRIHDRFGLHEAPGTTEAATDHGHDDVDEFGGDREPALV